MPPVLTAVIVDDEPPARRIIREYLRAFDRIEEVGTAGNGADAVDVIQETSPDLVFLDVQMPEGDGFEVLERLDRVPWIIFSTAYDAYALHAFDAGAVDYLLKPYKRARFEQAVERVIERHDQEQGSPSPDYADRLAAMLQKANASDDAPSRLYVRHGEKILPVATDAIRWIEAAGDYAKLHTDDGTYLSSAGLGALGDRLDADRFLRIHRSHIIALDAVDHLRSDGSGGYRVRLADGTRLRVSRTYAPEIRDRIV